MPNPISYLAEVRSEFAKVIWPKKSETVRLSITVIVVSVIVGVIITVLDLGFTRLASMFI